MRSSGALLASAVLLLSLALPASASHIPIAGSLPDSCREVEPSAEVPQIVEIGDVVFDIANWAIGRGSQTDYVGFTTSPIVGLSDGHRVEFAVAGSQTETVEGTLAAEGDFVSSAPNSISTVVFCLLDPGEPSTEPSASSSGSGNQGKSEPAPASGSADEAQSTEVSDETLARTGPRSDSLSGLAWSLVMAGVGFLLLTRWPEPGRHASRGN